MELKIKAGVIEKDLKFLKYTPRRLRMGISKAAINLAI